MQGLDFVEIGFAQTLREAVVAGTRQSVMSTFSHRVSNCRLSAILFLSRAFASNWIRLPPDSLSVSIPTAGFRSIAADTARTRPFG